MTSICLNMIVRNETRILERCLASVAPWISDYVIGDTGSEDGTPDLIRDFFKAKNIPGRVFTFPFVDYSQARNRSLGLCRFESKSDYILFTDADMELVVDDPEAFEGLSLPAYKMLQQAGITYPNTRLLRRSFVEARYLYPTHEYLDTCGQPVGDLSGAWFIDHAEGSGRVEKSERDERLLRGYLKEHPNDARCTFYLAQTLRDLGRHEEAIEYYDKRATLGGYYEEIAYSLYKSAWSAKNLEHEGDMLRRALDAFERQPSRAESLHMLAEHYRWAGKNQLSSMFALAGLKIPKPASGLFVEDYVYDVGFRHELSIAGYYSTDPDVKRTAREACLSLTIDPKTSDHVRHTARKNSVHYLRSAQEVLGPSKIRRITIETDPIYVPMNPSVAIDPRSGDLACIVRTVNYSITPTGHYVIRPEADTPDDTQTIRTKNELVVLDLDEDLEICVRSQKPIVDRTPTNDRNTFSVVGYEDCRLFFCRGRWWATATVRDRHPEGRCEIALLELEENEDEVSIVRIHVLRYRSDVHQKNWAPFAYAHRTPSERLLLLYGADPTIVLEFDFDSMALKESPVLEIPPDLALDGLRGSSQMVPFNLAGERGWLYVSHEAVDMPPRTYSHRFVWLDAGMRIQYVTEPFFLVYRGIEFCAGLAQRGDELLVSFGVRDASAHLMFVDADTVAKSLLVQDRR